MSEWKGGGKMRISQNLKSLLAAWEGVFKRVYLDSAGLATIGIGHLLTRSELTSGKIISSDETIHYQNGIIEQQCWDILEDDMRDAEETIDKSVKVPLTQNQFDSLVSFAFNIGDHAFWMSTLLKLLNAGLYEQVPGQMRRWNKVNGRIVQGLVNRREKEIELWNGEEVR
jgi:lysozyme